jgi:uncharacterized membrane protein YdjX (TVP38/TMEM64 family)
MSEVTTRLTLYFAFMLAALSVAPMAQAPATLVAAKVAEPWAVAGMAASAAAIAAVFDWHVMRRAFQIRRLSALRKRRLFVTAERWAKVSPFSFALIFAALPLPFLFARILVPLSGYPLPRYALAVSIGRFARIYVVALFGKAFEIPDRILIGVLVGGVVLTLAATLARRLGWLRGIGGADADPAPGADGAGEPPPAATSSER